MKRLLITGFAPFGGDKVNPSWQAVQALPDTVGQWELVKRELPVSAAWERAVGELDPLLLRPEERQALLALGHVLGRSGAAEQAEAIRGAEERLRLFTELDEKECMKRSRVRAAVGTGAGVMLAILLL